MNQKIKELWEKSAQRTDLMDEHRQEFFAKLIIDDIMTIMSDTKNYNRCVHTNHDLDRAKCVVAEIAKKIYEDYL
jgi:hypothetical protein